MVKDEERNCRNCGAPLNGQGDCEYCGTKSRRVYSSRIEMTVDRIVLYAEDHAVDSETIVRAGMIGTE